MIDEVVLKRTIYHTERTTIDANVPKTTRKGGKDDEKVVHNTPDVIRMPHTKVQTLTIFRHRMPASDPLLPLPKNIYTQFVANKYVPSNASHAPTDGTHVCAERVDHVRPLVGPH